MIHQIGRNTEKRSKNHRKNPGKFELVSAFLVYKINHKTGRKYNGNSKIKLEIFFKSQNEKGKNENLDCYKQEVDYETAVNVSVKNFETLFVFDDFVI